MDIDVERDGKRTKYTAFHPASSGPSSAPSESGSRGSGPGSQAPEESVSEGTKVNQNPSSSGMPDSIQDCGISSFQSQNRHKFRSERLKAEKLHSVNVHSFYPRGRKNKAVTRNGLISALKRWTPPQERCSPSGWRWTGQIFQPRQVQALAQAPRRVPVVCARQLSTHTFLKV